MDWVLVGILTVAVLTGAALVLLLIEPDVPVRDRRAGSVADRLDQPARSPVMLAEPSSGTVGTSAETAQGEAPYSPEPGGTGIPTEDDARREAGEL